jgi:uncharacterized protein (DUF1697 family)
MKKDVAFLRGINSGSNPPLKMETLRTICEGLGLKNVKTVLASGNVIFETNQMDMVSIENIFENGLAKTLGYKVTTIVKSFADIDKLMKSKPFAGLELTPQTRLYITFFKISPVNDLTFPYVDSGKGFTILGFDPGIIRSVVDLSRGMTPDLMDFLDKKFGKQSTTRNWNTIEKIYSMMV